MGLYGDGILKNGVGLRRFLNMLHQPSLSDTIKRAEAVVVDRFGSHHHKTMKEFQMATSNSTKGKGRGYRHGMRYTSEYRTWQDIQRRCHDQSRSDYSRYGGKGTVVCKRWRDSFLAFYEDMGPKPTPKHSIGRINNDGDYEPANCRWETAEQQANNKSSSHYLTHDGVTLTVAQWGRKLDISEKVLRRRLSRGWSVNEALTTPTMPAGRHNLRMLTYNGETLCIADWSRRNGIKPHTLAARLRYGWSVEKTLTTGVP